MEEAAVAEETVSVAGRREPAGCEDEGLVVGFGLRLSLGCFIVGLLEAGNLGGTVQEQHVKSAPSWQGAVR